MSYPQFLGINYRTIRMIVSSTPGGVIPQWIADRSMPSKIQEDVPAYIVWMHKRKEKAEKESSNATA